MTRRNPEADGCRIDPEDGRRVYAGQMTCAGFRAWWPSMVERWRAVMLDRSKPPTDEPVWMWDEWHGWLRRAKRR